MRGSSIDAAFTRYRETSDPRALAAVFDATAPELYRLGFHLTGDRHTAEDLVQVTFLTAMESAGEHDAGRAVLPWLCGILANRARDVRRRERLRRTKEAAARGDAVADPAAAAAALEVERSVTDGVHDLPEPYRQVLILHVLHGLGGKEIAELHGTNESTVRSQIRRGLDLLRRALPLSLAGGALACPPAELGAVRELVFAAATQRVAGAAAATSIGGAIAMKKPLLAAVVAAFVFLAGYLTLWPDPVPGGAAVPVPDRGARSAAAHGGDDPAQRSLHAPGAAGGAEADLACFGRVVDADTDAPVAGARVVITDGEAGEGMAADPARFEVSTDAGGCFRAPVGARQILDVEVQAARHLPARHNAVIAGREVVLRLLPVRPLEIAVWSVPAGGGDRRPVPDAVCRVVFGGGNDRRKIVVREKTGPDGKVSLPALRAGLHLVVDRPRAPSFVRIYDLADDVDHLDVVLPAAGGLRGRVVGAGGGPIAGAVVQKTYREELSVETGEDGEFTIPHVPPDDALWTVRAAGYVTAYVRVGSKSELGGRVPDVVLARAATLVGRVRGFAAPVEVFAVSRTAHYVHNRWRSSAVVTAGEQVELGDVVTGEPLVVLVRGARGRVAVAELPAAPVGGVATFGVLEAQDAPTLTGTVVDAGDQPDLIRVRVEYGQRSGLVLHDLTRVVRGGRFTLTGLWPGAARVWIRRGGADGTEQQCVLQCGAVRELHLGLGGVVRGRVLDARGRGVAGVGISISEDPRPMVYTDASGAFVCAGLREAGSYTVTPLLRGARRVVDPSMREDVQPGGPPLQFVVRAPGPGIVGQVGAEVLAAIPFENLYVLVSDGNGDSRSASVSEDGRFVVAVATSGPYRVELHALDTSGSTLSSCRVDDVPAVEHAVPGGQRIELRRSR